MTISEEREKITERRKMHRMFLKGYVQALIDHDYSYEYIAKKLNMSESSVRALMTREKRKVESD